MIVTQDERTGPSPGDGHSQDRQGSPQRPILPALSGFPQNAVLTVVPPCFGGARSIPWQTPRPADRTVSHAPVVIADSDADRAGQLAQTLAGRYEVCCCADGEAAVAAALSHGAEAILVDLGLLRRRRFKLLRNLREVPRTRDVPVIATAAGAADEALREALEAGVDDFLLKPFSRSELLARLGAARARGSARGEWRDGEARREILLDALDDGVFIAQNRRLVLANRALAALLGYRAEGCVGQPFEAVVAGEDLGLWYERYRLTVGDGPEPQGRHAMVWLRHGGERLAVEVTIRRVRHDGRWAMLGVVRRASGGQRPIATEQDTFIAMLAHELRNPLAPIRNAVGVLRAPWLAPPDLRWARDVIDRQVAQLGRLLDDLLDAARLTHGTLVLRRAPVDLAAAVERAVECCRPLLGFRRHALRQVLPGEPLHVEGDLPRLVQVFSNLLDNAARYTDVGGHIDLVLEGAPAEARVRIRDDGRGIGPELLPRLFEVFSQEARTLDRTEGGLGLGLALARRIVELHGGRIEAHSPGPGQGAEFVVRLPRITAAGAIPVGPGPGTRGEATGPGATGLRILVVDDNVDSADSMALLLSLDGHEVHTAFDGPGALAEAAAFRPRAVLLDIGLPGMDGYQVARRLRELPGLGDILVIAITGYGQDEDRVRSKAAGFDHHLVKPVDPETLSRLLASIG